MTRDPDSSDVSRKWRRAYLAVALGFAAQVALFYLFTRWYS